jgi:hypothetical protein
LISIQVDSKTLTKYIKEHQAMLESAGLAFSDKTVPFFYTKWSSKQVSSWLIGLSRNLKKYLEAKAISEAADIGNDAMAYDGPFFHPGVRSGRAFQCYPITEPMDGGDLNVLLPPGRQHLAKLVFSKYSSHTHT